MCCCKVTQCCCCLDLKKGIQFLGIVLTILYIIAIVSTSVKLSEAKQMVNECSEAEKNLASDVTHLTCMNNKNFERSKVKDYVDWWNKYFGLIIAAAVVFDALGVIVNGLLIMSTCNANRCLLLPWLIYYMIGIVLSGVGIATLLVLVIFSLWVVVVWKVLLLIAGKSGSS